LRLDPVDVLLFLLKDRFQQFLGAVVSRFQRDADALVISLDGGCLGTQVVLMDLFHTLADA
jgi:hypothetical protein